MSAGNAFLVIVRAGDDSLHERWLGAGERNWDLAVCYDGELPDRFRHSGVERYDVKGPKWRALGALLESGAIDLDAYEYVWLAQGDLLTSADDISRLFGICQGLDLWLAHPSLTHDSHAEHRVTLYNSQFGLRYTDYVEKTAPVFKTSFLRSAFSTLQVNETGGGIDYVWPKLVEDPARCCAVIDSVQVRRVRPMAGVARYEQAPAALEAEDADQLLSKLAIDERSEINLGALMRTGERYSLFDETADAFMGRLLRGMIGTAGGPVALGQVFLLHERARRAAAAAAQGGGATRPGRPDAATRGGSTGAGAQGGEANGDANGEAAPARTAEQDEALRNRAAIAELAQTVRVASLRRVRT